MRKFSAVVLGVAGYREKRKAALERFTRDAAAAVLESGQARALEPMGAADRKVVHDTVNDIVVNGPNRVFIERDGKLETYMPRSVDEALAANALAAQTGATVLLKGQPTIVAHAGDSVGLSFECRPDGRRSGPVEDRRPLLDERLHAFLRIFAARDLRGVAELDGDAPFALLAEAVLLIRDSDQR